MQSQRPEGETYLDQIGDPIITEETLGEIDNSDTLRLLSGNKSSVVRCLKDAAGSKGDEERYPNGEVLDNKFLDGLRKLSKEMNKGTTLTLTRTLTRTLTLTRTSP